MREQAPPSHQPAALWAGYSAPAEAAGAGVSLMDVFSFECDEAPAIDVFWFCKNGGGREKKE